MHSLHFIVGMLVIAFGLMFLALSLIAAYRDVFPPAEHLDQMRRSPDVRSYAELLATMSSIKSWLALAVVGTVLVLGGGFVASGGSAVFGSPAGVAGVVLPAKQ